MQRLILFAGVVLSIALIVGCGNIFGGLVERATGVDVDQDGDSVTIKTDDGEIKVGAGLPDELKDFPVPSGFENIEASGGTISSKEGKIISAGWEGPETDANEIFEFYESRLKGMGYEEQFSFSSSDGGLVSYAKESESEILAITVSTSGGETEIFVLLTITPE